MELREDDHLTGKACVTRQSLITALRYGHNQLLQPLMPLRCHQANFGQVGTQRIYELSSLVDQQNPVSGAASARLLLNALDRHKPH